MARWVWLAAITVTVVLALRASPAAPHLGRRDALLRAGTILTTAITTPQRSYGAAEEMVEVYFGVGCFWHVQHELAMAEKQLLRRSDSELTARAGYAGGLSIGKDASRPGRPVVCYHNLQRIADYGKLGHGEVVKFRFTPIFDPRVEDIVEGVSEGYDIFVCVQIPASSVSDFAQEYHKLFDTKGDRPDKLDVGPEYRSILGLPGGVDSLLFPSVRSNLPGLTLQAGKGNDPDTLGKKVVWVYDTNAFGFHQAEVYHQFHDGFFPGEDYPKSYNKLASVYYEGGKLSSTGCPDIV